MTYPDKMTDADRLGHMLRVETVKRLTAELQLAHGALQAANEALKASAAGIHERYGMTEADKVQEDGTILRAAPPEAAET